MRLCPHCRGPVRRFAVLRHRWWVCGACGSATRAGAPADLREAFFPAAADHGARELAELDGWLAHAGLAARGAILDVGGGPGFAAARLAARPGVRRVALLEYSRPALDAARALGVEAHAYDFDGAALPDVVRGPFDLLLVRYALAWCGDAGRLAGGLTAVAAPDAHLVVTWALPTRGGLWICAHERAAPRVLWGEAAVDAAFRAAGWAVHAPFTPSPPLAYPHGWRRAALGLPQALRPHPLPLELRQLHAGRVYRRAAPAG